MWNFKPLLDSSSGGLPACVLDTMFWQLRQVLVTYAASFGRAPVPT